MNINEGYEVGIIRLMPHGRNITMFTECCQTAICNDQIKCPSCGRKIIGAEAETDYERGQVRWRYATSHWDRSYLYKH